MLSPVARCRRPARGLTLIECLLALAIAALLAGLAYPGYAQQQLRAHRADAIARLAQIQQQQERWRSNRPAYASAADLFVAGDTRYAITVDEVGPAGYRLTARAIGPQAADAGCAWLSVQMRGGEVETRSGPAIDRVHEAAANARCWMR